jgi:hypothetical protein
MVTVAWPHVPRVAGAAREMLCLTFLAALPAPAAVHLMFPYDYLSLNEDERRAYVLGVVDTRLAPLRTDDALDWRSRCLTRHGITEVQAVLEEMMIPTPGSAVIPMPYLVERAITHLCGTPPASAR